MPAPVHVSVMPGELIEWLNPQPGQTIVDGTLGGCGHTRLLADRVGDSGQIISLDRDPQAIAAAEQILRGLPVKLVQANFAELPQVLKQLQLAAVHGIVLDLGLSSDQLGDADRGFSFTSDGPLDLRFDPDAGQPAWQLLAHLPQDRLADLIYEYGEERFSRRIARAIVERRRSEPIRTAAELAALVRRCVPRSKGPERIDPATRTFQALRIAVNEELKSLETVLEAAPGCLHAGGRLAVLSFHSLEDRRVKEAFRSDPRWEILTKRPLRPGEAEVHDNPRARSAKLRVAARR